MSRWSFAASLPLIAAGLAVWLTAAWICFSIYKRSGSRRAVAWLESLRFLLITLLAFTLFRPELVQTIRRTDPPEIAILVDASGSMQTRDIPLSNNIASRAEWIQRQDEAKIFAPMTKQARIVVEQFPELDSPAPGATNQTTPAGTDLNQALQTVLQRERNLKAVLLLTDGDWNVGKSPVGIATQFRERNIPIFSAAVGQSQALPDLALQQITAPSYGLLGEQVAIPFSVKSSLARDVTTTISLFNGREVVAKKDVVIPANGELHDAVIWAPTAVGETPLELRLPKQEDEMLAENNAGNFQINVRMETLKVLVIDSLPRWEYRYLRNALERDPGVEMHCVLLHPQLGPGAGRHYLPAFPSSKEMLARYDVVFLGDVGIGEGELTQQDAEYLRGLVEQQASGLVFLPGRRGRQNTFVDSPLKELIPVVLDTTQPQGTGLRNEAPLLLSTSGKSHWLTRFHTDEEQNAEIWKQLPGFYWAAAIEKSRPGSSVLAVHSGLRNSWGRIPLIVTRSAGNGTVLFMGVDTAWRWRRGVEDKYHYRFWSQVVRWMSHRRHLSENEGIRLTFSPESPNAGDTVFLQAAVFDSAGFPSEGGEVTGTIRSASGAAERIEFTPLEGGWGVFKTSFTPQQGGPHQIEISAKPHDRQLKTTLHVEQPELEKIGQPVNLEILGELASITEGASGSYKALDQLIQQISLLPEPKPMETRIRLWSNPWWGGLILLLLAIYWTGRKLAGML